MFTGIIEEVGEIKGIKSGDKSCRLIILANKVLDKTKIGDSIATNGVCLTVDNLSGDYFEADVMAETLRRSNLKTLSIGNKVNLERALRLDDRLGGHIVSGHIDGTGKIISFVKEDNAMWITVETTIDILRYVVYKGSVTIDGISLTVAYVNNSHLKVSIIPHTFKETTLLNKRTGDEVNIECDLLGKYIEKFTTLNQVKKENNENPINERFLIDNGFL